MKIGKNTSIGMHTVINAANHIKIGSNTAIGQNVYLDGRGGLRIGNNVNFTTRSSIYTTSHDYKFSDWRYFTNPVEVCDNSWVASNSIILPGIRVGRGAVIAAGAVVTKDVGEFEIVAGNPAKKIRNRPTQIDYLTNYFPLFY